MKRLLWVLATLSSLYTTPAHAVEPGAMEKIAHIAQQVVDSDGICFPQHIFDISESGFPERFAMHIVKLLALVGICGLPVVFISAWKDAREGREWRLREDDLLSALFIVFSAVGLFCGGEALVRAPLESAALIGTPILAAYLLKRIGRSYRASRFYRAY